MSDLIQQFALLWRQISRLPFSEQEMVCKSIQFSLEDYVKRFPPYAIKTYMDVFGTLDREVRFCARDKTILEIGPGFSVGVLFLAGLSGARKVCAVDAFPHDKGSDHEFISSMYEHLLRDRTSFFTDIKTLGDDAFTDTFARFITRDDQGRFSYRNDKLDFRFPYTVENLPWADSSFDCVYSSATFEHFRNPYAAAKELYRVTTHDGINYHSVDLRDHRNFDKPLDFLTVNKEQWQGIGNASGSYSHTNRLRSSEIATCFERQGFRVLKEIPFLRCTVTEELKQRLHPDFRRFSDDELGILGCIYIFQK
jgi:SAM-dependent methyltransferase